jgi:hypothetical protein
MENSIVKTKPIIVKIEVKGKMLFHALQNGTKKFKAESTADGKAVAVGKTAIKPKSKK